MMTRLSVTAPPGSPLLLTLSVFSIALLAGACTTEGGGEGWSGGEERPLFTDLSRFGELPDQPMASASSDFWDWWGDGQAEMSGYRMTTMRYGAPRETVLSLIYVTEPHDRRSWIKDDDIGGSSRVEVLKLNQNFHFQTGVYPYSVMTSVFAPVHRYRTEPFAPVRITHTVQEWCGAYSHLVWPGESRFRSLRLSYFAHEGERMSEVRTEPGTLYEDALLIQLRELDGAFAGGGDWEGALVPELWRLRAGHRGTRPVPATIVRSDTVRSTSEGTVPVTRFTLDAGDYRRSFDVEKDHPRRILGWATSTGEEAEILATARLAYWQLNRPGDESWLEAMGLGAGVAGMADAGEAPAGVCPG